MEAQKSLYGLNNPENNSNAGSTTISNYELYSEPYPAQTQKQMGSTEQNREPRSEITATVTLFLRDV